MPNVCANCLHSRDEQGNLFADANRAFCVHPTAILKFSVSKVPCESLKMGRASNALTGICGTNAIFWQARS